MKQKRFYRLASLLLFTFLQFSFAQTYNSLRIAYICPNDNGHSISTAFLARAKANGYTHVNATYFLNESQYNNPVDWSNGSYLPGYRSGRLHDCLKRDFLLVNSYGMKLIPDFQIGSPDAIHWNVTNTTMDLYPQTCDDPTRRPPCIAPGMQTNGFDKSFKEVIRIIAAAFDDAVRDAKWNSSYGTTLEYMTIGYSEAFASGAYTTNAKILYGTGTGNVDTRWLAANPGKDLNDLVVASIKARINTIRTQSNITSRTSKTCVIVWGDMFDPQALCRTAVMDKPLTTVVSKAKAAGLTDKLIFGQWQYVSTRNVTGEPYDILAALKAFTDNSFKTLYISIVCDGDGQTGGAFVTNALPHLIKTIQTANDPNEIRFKNKIIGFMSAHWDGPGLDQAPTGYDQSPAPPLCFNTMEYMAYGNKIVGTDDGMKYIPAKRDINQVVTQNAFLMGRYEVTQGLYWFVMQKYPSFFFQAADLSYPVENITYYDAILFCNALSKIENLDTVYSYTANSVVYNGGHCIQINSLAGNYNKNGYRLPTQAEWEFAYQAGTTTPNYWGNDVAENYAWISSNSSGTTHPVGKKIANQFGLFDMAGNTEEWIYSSKYAGGCYINPSYSTRLKVSSTTGGLSVGAFYNWLGMRIVKNAPSNILPQLYNY